MGNYHEIMEDYYLEYNFVRWKSLWDITQDKTQRCRHVEVSDTVLFMILQELSDYDFYFL